MKYYVVRYYDAIGAITSVIISARNKNGARKKFIRDYGYYTIIMIKEVDV